MNSDVRRHCRTPNRRSDSAGKRRIFRHVGLGLISVHSTLAPSGCYSQSIRHLEPVSRVPESLSRVPNQSLVSTNQSSYPRSSLLCPRTSPSYPRTSLSCPQTSHHTHEPVSRAHELVLVSTNQSLVSTNQSSRPAAAVLDLRIPTGIRRAWMKNVRELKYNIYAFTTQNKPSFNAHTRRGCELSPFTNHSLVDIFSLNLFQAFEAGDGGDGAAFVVDECRRRDEASPAGHPAVALRTRVTYCTRNRHLQEAAFFDPGPREML